jgi:flagellar assembly protein FliH
MKSKVISGKKPDQVQLWKVPNIGIPHADKTARNPQRVNQKSGLVTVEQIDDIHNQAYQEGYELGRVEGLKTGAEEAEHQAQRLESLMTTLCMPFEQLDNAVEEQIVALVIAIVRQLVRRELRSEPGEILRIVREAMGILPIAARDVQLHLHPEDAALVRESLSLSDSERPWRIVEDPVLTRGDCRVFSDSSQIDATVETRLNAIVVSMLGGERDGDLLP